MGIIDHVSVFVTDLDRSEAFYTAALEPLGIKPLMRHPGGIGYGRNKPEVWLAVGPASYHHGEAGPPTPIHLALAAEDREQVTAFYNAAIEAGGTDFGPPGPRPEYHENYFGAFVLDLDGHNLEAVCHGL